MIFDALPNYDPRNKLFPATAAETPKKLRSRMWDCPQWLNQDGNHGCAAYATEHDRVTLVNLRHLLFVPFTVSNLEVAKLYTAAQRIDEFEGQEPVVKGTSVVACMKVLKQWGKIQGYQHAFGLAQLKQTLSHVGPVVLTCPWHYKMTQPDSAGLVKVGGPVVGWHAMLIRGMSLEDKLFILRQNGGRDYGNNGDIKITFKGMALLLKEGGTLCLARL